MVLTSIDVYTIDVDYNVIWIVLILFSDFLKRTDFQCIRCSRQDKICFGNRQGGLTQSLLLLRNGAVKKQIPILMSLVSPDRGSNPWSSVGQSLHHEGTSVTFILMLNS
jgi:hypothetical protein